MEQLRHCKGCDKDLPISFFNKKLKGLQHLCKSCNKRYLKLHRLLYPERQILSGIKQRCNNPKSKDYKDYGLRGIKCLISETEILKLMIQDNYKDLKNPTINRKNNDGNYCFDNCEFIEEGLNSAERNTRVLSKAILQFDLDNNYIQEFSSLTTAAKIIKISRAAICSALKGRTKTAGGFKWSYNERI